MSKGIAAVGDLHHARLTYASHPSMLGDTDFALAQVTQHCRDNDLALLLLGDNFDKNLPEPESVSSFLSYTRDLEIAYIVGQHDRRPEFQWPSIDSTAQKLCVHLGTDDYENRCLSLGGIDVYGFDYQARNKFEERLKRVPDDCELLALHGSHSEVMQLSDAWHFDLKWVPPHVKYLIAGDWHGLPQAGATDYVTWLYTGSATMRSVKEPINKSFVVCTRGSAGDLLFTRIPLKTRPFIAANLQWESELDEWLDAIVKTVESRTKSAIDSGVPAEVSIPFVSLHYNVELPDVYGRISSVLEPLLNKGKIIFHSIPMRVLYGDEAEITEDGEVAISVSDALAEAVDPVTAPVLHGFLTGLLDAADPDEVIEAFKLQYGITGGQF